MIVISPKILKILKVDGLTFFPFIFLRQQQDRKNKILINHEKIHIRQQIELLLIFFYIWYFGEYFYWLLRLKNHDLAYRHISFEREAYAKENDLTYLKKRKPWAFINYIAS